MSKQVDRLITEALAIEAEEAREAGALGYMARALVQATIPHRATTETTFTRKNGNYTFTMLANPQAGLPYGTVPRLMLAWLATEAVTTQSRELELGNSLSDFMRQLDMVPTGGRWGSITRLKSQTRRLFSSFIQCTYIGKDEKGHVQEAIQNMVIADSANLWWEPKDANQASLFASTVTLSESFYSEIVCNPVPVDLRALKALKKSPMALDIYCWLTYRMSYLKKPTTIPWAGLQAQFGAGYPDTGQGQRDFKKKFLLHMKKVLTVYPEARAGEGVSGLLIRPSKPHIPKL
jgi:hypothetical protein